MPKKNGATPKAKLPMELTLSTGYKVKFDLGNVQAGLQHFARALSGEIFLETAKKTAKTANKPSWEPSVYAVQKEIAHIVKGMSNGTKSGMLFAMFWDIFCHEQGRIGDKLNKAARNKK